MVQSHLPPFRNLSNFVYPTFACLSEETLKAGGPFYLVSMLCEVKDPTQGGKCLTCSGLTNSRLLVRDASVSMVLHYKRSESFQMYWPPGLNLINVKAWLCQKATDCRVMY